MNDLNQSEPRDLSLAGWTIKYRPPIQQGAHQVIWMNHGWTGDERSMWVFASQMPKNAWLIAPRAPYPSTSDKYGGFSWVADRTDGWSDLSDFDPAVQSFSNLLSLLPSHLDADFSTISLLGFSQGTAFNFAFAMQHPSRIGKLALLAGFMPEGSQATVAQRSLQDVPVFIAHGKNDATVPLERAHQARDLLQRTGAKVEYCESDVGHKLGANCFSQLRTFFAEQ